MRILSLIVFFTLIRLNAYSGFDPTPIFPSDINKYPLLFLCFSEPSEEEKLLMGVDFDSAEFYFPRQELRVKKIEQFIIGHTEFKHLLVEEEELNSYSSEIYKYVIRYKLVEIYSYDSIPGSDNRDYATKHKRKFTSAFCIQNRQTGLDCNPYIDPKSYRTNRGTVSSNNLLPMSIPKDADFFKDLINYTNRLNKYGADLTLETDKKRYAQNPQREKNKNLIVTTAAISTFVGSYIIFQILINSY